MVSLSTLSRRQRGEWKSSPTLWMAVQRRPALFAVATCTRVNKTQGVCLMGCLFPRGRKKYGLVEAGTDDPVTARYHNMHVLYTCTVRMIDANVFRS